MKSDLDELIAELEFEKQLIQKSIDDCVKDEDYLNAHHNYQARNKLNRELETLYKLRDPLYFEKEHILRILDMYKYSSLRMGRFDDRFLSENRQKSIRDEEEKLNRLNQQKYTYYDGQEIDNALFDLYKGKLAGFKLYINQQENIYFEFSLNNHQNLLISIDASVEAQQYMAAKSPLLFFKTKGFKINEVNNKLNYLYDKPFKDATTIKELLAQIIFKLYNASIQAPFIELIYPDHLNSIG
ncbi:hypothetical protein [Mucilaginibacter agri]|uniref:Uncharacterized protein n=1 Tax=Mucilaginibacter agri TaxID=2695265 RepID=A0A965ZGD9_9SPHI|nr:hypothetical protein [Mucilaginibacter agri]NCD70175.1 hypothetical protein [Mucilaginibacter agri]